MKIRKYLNFNLKHKDLTRFVLFIRSQIVFFRDQSWWVTSLPIEALYYYISTLYPPFMKIWIIAFLIVISIVWYSQTEANSK